MDSVTRCDNFVSGFVCAQLMSRDIMCSLHYREVYRDTCNPRLFSCHSGTSLIGDTNGAEESAHMSEVS